MIDDEQKIIKISLKTFILGIIIIGVIIGAISMAMYLKALKVSKEVVNLSNTGQEITKNEV